jgi:formylmethanofuran dehydrogenase subunit E
MKPFEELLASSVATHGHLCPGQVGVRMAMLGCRLIGLDNPSSHDQIKKLIVYVEMDRCTADAIAHVTYFKDAREITWQDMNWSPVPRQSREERERS